MCIRDRLLCLHRRGQGCAVGATAPPGRRKKSFGVIYRENLLSAPQAEQESILGHFCSAGEIWRVGMVHLVVLAFSLCFDGID